MNKTLVALLTTGLIVVGSVELASADSSNSPKNGNVVQLKDGSQTGEVDKWCDGPNLVYQSFVANSGGIAVIPNSPECK